MQKTMHKLLKLILFSEHFSHISPGSIRLNHFSVFLISMFLTILGGGGRLTFDRTLKLGEGD